MVLKALKSTKRAAGRPRKKSGAPTHRKPTEQIRYADAKKWIMAIEHARVALAQPMTVHVTVQWKNAPSATPEPERVSNLLNDLAIWIRRRTHQRAVWAYSREGGPKKGVHLHLLVHVPPYLIGDFTIAVGRWVKAKSETFDPRAVKVDPIYLPTLDTLKSYLLKEGEARVHEACGVLPEHRNGRNGYLVPGKRLGVSHSIDATARTRHSYAPINPPGGAETPINTNPAQGEGGADLPASGLKNAPNGHLSDFAELPA